MPENHAAIVNTHSGRRRLLRRWPLVVLWLMIALYLAYFGWFTLRAYDVFVYQAHDLGIYDQAVWNTLHGRPFRSTLEEPYVSLLGDHFEPILLPITLTYLLWESPKMLLLIQATGLALGALPVYLLARHRLSPSPVTTSEAKPSPPSTPVELASLGFALLYLLYPPVHSANVFEFHPSALAIPFLLYTLYFLRARRFGLYLLFLILTMSTKEVMPLTTLAVGVYALFAERRRVVGLATVVLSAAWFVLAIFVVIPHFSPEDQSQYFALFYGSLGDTAGEVALRLLTDPGLVIERLTRPDSLLYMGRLLQPLAYLPLLGLPVLLLGAPALLLNVLSDFSFQHLSLNFFQYAAAIAPFVIVAAVDGTGFLVHHLARVTARRQRRHAPVAALSLLVVAVMIATSLAAQRYHGFLPFSADYYLTPRDDKVVAAEAIVSQVPADVVVSTDRVLGPHLSHRPTLYLYPSVHDAEYVAVDASYRDSPFPPRDRYDAVQAMLAHGYGIVDGQDGFLLLQRGLDRTKPPEAFYGLARAGTSSPEVSTDIVFGGVLRLVGFDLVWERPVRPHAYLTLYWQAVQPVDRDLRLFFVQSDLDGELIPGTELEFASAVWYPPVRWAPGEAVRTDTLHWSLEVPTEFGIVVGIVDGPGFWDLPARLSPTLHSTPWETPRVHDGSLVWLATLEADGRVATLHRPESQ